MGLREDLVDWNSAIAQIDTHATSLGQVIDDEYFERKIALDTYLGIDVNEVNNTVDISFTNSELKTMINNDIINKIIEW